MSCFVLTKIRAYMTESLEKTVEVYGSEDKALKEFERLKEAELCKVADEYDVETLNDAIKHIFVSLDTKTEFKYTDSDVEVVISIEEKIIK